MIVIGKGVGKMAVLLTNKIELSGLGYNFSIDLHMPIVALMGNSGIGKTVMWKKRKAEPGSPNSSYELFTVRK